MSSIASIKASFPVTANALGVSGWKSAVVATSIFWKGGWWFVWRGGVFSGVEGRLLVQFFVGEVCNASESNP